MEVRREGGLRRREGKRSNLRPQEHSEGGHEGRRNRKYIEGGKGQKCAKEQRSEEVMDEWRK